MFHIPHYSYDFHPRIGSLRAAEFYPLAQRVFIGPEATGHSLVDDRYSGGFFMILPAEIAPSSKRNAHRLQIVRADRAPPGLRDISGRARRPPLDGKTEVGVPGQRKSAGHSGGLNAGQSPDPLQRLLEEEGSLLDFSVLRLWKGHLHRQDAARIEAGIDPQQAREAVDHQPGADQKR